MPSQTGCVKTANARYPLLLAPSPFQGEGWGEVFFRMPYDDIFRADVLIAGSAYSAVPKASPPSTGSATGNRLPHPRPLPRPRKPPPRLRTTPQAPPRSPRSVDGVGERSSRL